MKKIILFFFAIFYFNNLYADTCNFSWKVNKKEYSADFTFENPTGNIAKITGFKIYTKDKKIMWEREFIDNRTGKIVPLYVQPFSKGYTNHGNLNLMWDLAQSASILCKSLTRDEYTKEVNQRKANKRPGVTAYDLLEWDKQKKFVKKLYFPEIDIKKRSFKYDGVKHQVNLSNEKKQIEIQRTGVVFGDRKENFKSKYKFRFEDNLRNYRLITRDPDICSLEKISADDCYYRFTVSKVFDYYSGLAIKDTGQLYEIGGYITKKDNQKFYGMYDLLQKKWVVKQWDVNKGTDKYIANDFSNSKGKEIITKAILADRNSLRAYKIAINLLNTAQGLETSDFTGTSSNEEKENNSRKSGSKDLLKKLLKKN
tara:strand:+ start:591 stop:1697 length:1107 start_codon:yes stop_codon:yes gene_type:complete